MTIKIFQYYLYIQLLISITCFSQSKNVNVSTAETSFQEEFNKYDLYIQDKKYDDAIKVISQVTKSKNDLELVVAYANLADAYVLKKEYVISNQYLDKARKIVEKTKTNIDDAYYYHIRGRIFFRKEQNQQAIKYLFESNKILENLPNQELMISYNYYYLTLIEAAARIYTDNYKKYSQKNIEYALKTNNLQLLLLSYIEQTIFDEAAYLKFKRKEDLNALFKNSEILLDLVNKNVDKGLVSNRTIIISYNNSATYINNYPYKNYSQYKRALIAEEQILKGIEVAKKTNIHKDLMGYCYLTYGEIQNSLGNEALTEKYYLDAYKIVDKTSIYNYAFSKIISHYLSALYKKQGKFDLALFYKEEENNYTKKLYEESLDDKKKYLETYYNTEQKNQQIKQLEEKNSIYAKQTLLYTGIIALAIAGLIFLAYLIRYRNKLNKQKTDLLQSEKIETELTLELEKQEKARLKAEKELNDIQQEQLQKAALATSLQLDKKNSFINDLKEKVKDDKSINLDRILKDERLTDEDFSSIINLVQDVHPNFFKKINEVSKNKLTNLDLKYAAYIYLNMDNLKIANLLKVEPKTVRMAKYRLKQKLGIDKEEDLAKFIQKLDL